MKAWKTDLAARMVERAQGDRIVPLREVAEAAGIHHVDRQDAVEIVRSSFADVDDVAGNAFSGRGGRDDAVGAHRVELQRRAVLFVGSDWRDGRDRIHEGRVGRAVRVLGGLRRERLGGVEFLFDDLVRIKGLQSLEDVVRRRLVFLRAGQTVGFG